MKHPPAAEVPVVHQLVELNLDKVMVLLILGKETGRVRGHFPVVLHKAQAVAVQKVHPEELLVLLEAVRTGSGNPLLVLAGLRGLMGSQQVLSQALQADLRLLQQLGA